MAYSSAQIKRKGIVAAGAVTVLLLTSCASTTRDKWARVFFDGVPSLDATELFDADGMSPELRVSQQVRHETMHAPKTKRQHEPYAHRDCRACHRPDKPQEFVRNAEALCLECHQSVLSVARTDVLSRQEQKRVLDAVMGGNQAQAISLIQRLGFKAAYYSMRNGVTLLHLATKGDQKNVADLLISLGADVDSGTRDQKYTPLHWAARKDAIGVARSLISAGASIDAKSVDGMTPLLAVGRSNRLTRVAQLLLKQERMGLELLSVKNASSPQNHPAIVAEFKHSPAEEGECLECHVAHESTEPFLLKRKGNATCFGCHEREDIVAGPQHALAQDASCWGCHTPHAGRREHLLTEDANVIRARLDRKKSKTE
jgi:predicted CXXCH cytochrome family protein